VFCSQVDLFAISAFSWASLSATAPFLLRSATVMPDFAFLRASALGVYQMGEVQARSWRVAATTSGGATPSCLAWKTGHKTRAMFDRYSIASTKDIEAALLRATLPPVKPGSSERNPVETR
jgi:hypothetical protein